MADMVAECRIRRSPGYASDSHARAAPHHLEVPLPRIQFPNALRRHVDCPDAAVDGQTLREAFDRYFETHPTVRGYVLDETGGVRRHILVFVDGRPWLDRRNLDGAISDNSMIEVLQALSGG